MASIYTAQTFSKWAEEYSLNILLSFFLFGLIFMVAIYNGSLYLYNREKSFLYYMFMQFFMLGVLLYETDLIHTYVKGNIELEEAFEQIDFMSKTIDDFRNFINQTRKKSLFFGKRDPTCCKSFKF